MLYTYEKILEKIENAHRFGNLPGVEVTERVVQVLGDPMKEIPYIHVAGTNGKGSTCAFLDQILRQMGFTVGCFTSPHLVDFCERITVNGRMIARADVTRLGNRLLATQFGVVLTMFDYCLAMAMLYFQERKCDIVVIETGLGGRLDSTNALGVPEMAVITHIGYDHMGVLGSQLTDIASEKAGILKEGVPAVFEPQEPEVLKVLLARMLELARQKYASDMRIPGAQPDSCAEPDYYVVGEEDLDKAAGYVPGLCGAYQLQNAAAAEQVIWQMWNRYQHKGRARGAEEDRRINVFLAEERGHKLTGNASDRMGSMWRKLTKEEVQRCIREGIHMTSWPGRMEILSKSPFFMVDGAHNSDGVRALADSLQKLYPGDRFHFIMGVMADKDYGEMVEFLLPLALDFVTVTPESERALQGEELAELIRAKGIPARAVREITQVIDAPKAGERTVALGSLYFIGDVKRLWQKQDGQ